MFKKNYGGIKKLLSFLCAFLLSGVAFVFAEKAAENLDRVVLDNGLTVFTSENHNVPLVYIEVAVRAGAITQTAETAGLFHLYEHMMFKGNALYKDAASVNKALSDLGVANWNGTTGVECVNYFFTIPSNKLEEGLAFWNAAVRSPLMDPVEFENEKKVVLAEITGNRNDPNSIFYDYYLANMFPDAPYQVSSGGMDLSVQKATIAQMREMQSKYYIPANSAVFVGGDINTQETYELVKKIFGTWSNNGNSAPGKAQRQNPAPFAKPKFAVMPYDKISPQTASIEVVYRGADSDFDLHNTYVSDFFLGLTRDPMGSFKQTLVKNKALSIPSPSYIGVSYPTSRASAILSFSAQVTNPQDNMAQRGQEFLRAVLEDALPAVLKNKSYYSKKYMDDFISRVKDEDASNLEPGQALLNYVRFWWTSAGTDYYFTYHDNLSRVTKQDVDSLINDYVYEKSPLVLVAVNDQVFEQHKDEYVAAGYEIISRENSDWRLMDQYAPEFKDTDYVYCEDKNIYVPESGDKIQQEIKDLPYREHQLKNGIKVYIRNDESFNKVSTAIVLKGGINHLSFETSGLENSLFAVMAMSSKKYSYEKRQYIRYKTSGNIDYQSTGEGSWLMLDVLDKYYSQGLDVLLDGFMNPDFNKDVVKIIYDGWSDMIQHIRNDPRSYIDDSIWRTLYEGHPYQVRPSVCPESLENITADNMEKLYREIIDPEDICVVANGNVDEKLLLSKLEKTLGKISSAGRTGIRVKNKMIPALEIKDTQDLVLEHPSAKGSGYASRVFVSPAVNSPDHIVSVLAAKIYSDVMFNVVREHYGVCYTPRSSVKGGFAPYGQEFLYMVSDWDNFKMACDQARSYMEKGQVVKSSEKDKSFVLEPLENRIQGYKNSLINETYSSMSSCSGKVYDAIDKLLVFNDLNYGQKQLEQLQNVTARDVLEVFNKYWVNSGSRWIMVR